MLFTVTLRFAFSLAMYIDASCASPGMWSHSSSILRNLFTFWLKLAYEFYLLQKPFKTDCFEIWGTVMSLSSCLRDWGVGLLCARQYNLVYLSPATVLPLSKMSEVGRAHGEEDPLGRKGFMVCVHLYQVSATAWISHRKISTDLILPLNFLNITDATAWRIYLMIHTAVKWICQCLFWWQ